MEFPVVIDTSQAEKETLRRLDEGHQRIALVGAPSSGKTTALMRLASHLASQGWRTFQTSMPTGDDAGPLALTLIADQAGSGAVVRDAAVPWSGKLRATLAAIRQAARSSHVLVTLDDPVFEQPGDDSDPFTEHATSLIGALSGIENVAFIVASSRHVPQSWGQIVKLEVTTDVVKVLEAFDSGPLAAAARQIAQRGADKLARRSPAEVRLLVAVNASQGRGRTAFQDGAPPLVLLQQALDVWGSQVRRALRALAVLRTPFDDQALEELLEGVPDDVGSMIRGVVLHRTSSGWVVPEIVGRVVRSTSRERDRPSVDDLDERRGHQIACAYHRRAFARVSSEDVLLTSIRHELEELHHLTMLNDAATIFQRSIYFADHYDMLGKRLGQAGVRAHGDERRRLLQRAITAYERALELDKDDAYAHHYLAYNVDWLATAPTRAEDHYLEALRLRRDRVWHHGRWISFLITHGRVIEARVAWSSAMEEFGDDPPAHIFDELHRQVGRLLLHRGELDFAKLVLDDLTAEANALPWARAERRLYERLDQAARDQLVFPSSVDATRRWNGPHLVPAEARPRIKRWWAGRVEAWRDGEVVLRLAESPGRFGRKTLAASDFRRWLGVPLQRVPAGTFIELVHWRNTKQQIFVHPDEVEDVDLPPVIPPADRYLRRAAVAAALGA